MSSQQHLNTELAIFYGGDHLDCLWKRLDFLDTQGGTFLDIASRKLNPFAATVQKMMMFMVVASRGQPIQTLWHQFALRPTELVRIKRKVFNYSSSVLVQLWWWFLLPLDNPPFSMVPGCVKKEQRLPAARMLFRVPDCCAEPYVAAKTRTNYETPERLASATTYWDGLRLAMQEWRQANMHVERLFALIKKNK